MRFPLIEFNSNAVVTADIDVSSNNLRLRYSIAVTPGLVWPEFTALERKMNCGNPPALNCFSRHQMIRPTLKLTSHPVVAGIVTRFPAIERV